ncbi:hypothetical protein O9G_003098 [Rozella allomycis CSF55]|uniref:Uncharacterized protein n=1 Tax=Rozella allomycis (strain CSF55) TaxID=988480 RepID=A0A075AWP7_ROZAC|nr:hypothetical protein O9G_003098 [Rozella allomycis CSF55]|eukprot:EPZ33102.1 hypothetical protein O9G_003098 [Rozella allomycis CSF55]
MSFVSYDPLLGYVLRQLCNSLIVAAEIRHKTENIKIKSKVDYKQFYVLAVSIMFAIVVALFYVRRAIDDPLKYIVYKTLTYEKLSESVYTCDYVPLFGYIVTALLGFIFSLAFILKPKVNINKRKLSSKESEKSRRGSIRYFTPSELDLLFLFVLP